MFYATAGQQATQQPPTSRITGYPRNGPPGFSVRSSDPNDFPALGSHSQHNSSYIAQNQGGQSSTNASHQNTHLQQQQQQHLYMQQQQQQQQQQLGVTAAPPPGISGPTASASSQSNGGLTEEFPALGASSESKDGRMANFFRNPSSVHQPIPSSPSPLPNGTSNASASQSADATPSTNPPHPQSGIGGPASTTDSWQRQSPRNTEPVVRPVQQILSSPVDRWGLKALLFEIQMHMNKTDRGMMVFGEDLEELGVDINSEEALYPTFVTPWAEPNSLPPPQIEESFHIPQCYYVHAPPVESKLQNFAEDTLFLAFYMSPQDVLQLRVAEELYARGWRYHTELQTWLTSPTLASIDLSKADRSSGQPNWIRGPFAYLDTRTWVRQRTAEDFTIDANVLELTKLADDVIREEAARKEAQKSPSGVPVNGQNQAQSQGQQQNQGQALSYQR
ncbi:CCR4-NOT transcription complex subunit 2 [Cryptococcus neoformans C23]|uniref:CCR4-NOT transcription complex subunit 2 n=2 Tax=Cryptococcus neoformans TaxID=5207 RepID=A0A854QII9_CRYNE|nr:CCR4-NOT transcription complex subunit 2 [Cryptococcus neoformans var. grubii H99]AUB28148.1 CCR4-NOT transcription complex subunit 2 [Cryptococcus neoformans var. grubii]OWZ30782.1 CCR4-NOT transcription complex subunit 2 [Cryptococcus neoformans var. grubii AD1-83a]OWZ34556.1 CCR4-NOT transcription complex subunit 2 [Cryptococcus neoformans var. grubii AD2-60a]OWZ46640.1 CCR4-NOT transcription complex subunit 2 [Cryptococcus neoformans var. grubii C23]OXC81825.1 CCR4-NOT transcription com|eukprot:XP_012052802.1 CCR4-NOT transcription complex subunit 2 [Cryptococcus neoformans var. grubii H99]